jgi:hypothetical protein
MRKHLLVVLTLLLSVTVALGQSKVATKWHCPKPTAEQKFDVGDTPDHIYWIGQGACEATSSTGDLKDKSGKFTEFHDAWKTTYNFHGYFIETTENGDQVNYRYEGSNPTDISKPVANKWKIVGGTGKNKGIKGSGTCAGKFNADRTSDWECTGTYSVGK